LLIPTYRHWIARMAELKTKCDKCGVDILQTTADGTGGLCMPCKLGRPPIPPPTSVKASCFVSSSLGTDVLFITCAQDLLTILEGTRTTTIGGGLVLRWFGCLKMGVRPFA
jgi:hypothetical protein